MDNDQNAALPAEPMSGATAAEPDMSQGYCIKLCVMPDKTMKIGVEPLSEEDIGDTSDEEEGEYQPVSSMGEAMRLIKDLVMHEGDQAEASAGQDAMAAGYK